MAIIRPGAVITDIRGSIRGTTFARNQAGLYARGRTKPVFPGTLRQTAVNAHLATAVNNWRAVLTPTQRTAWESLAKQTQMQNHLGDPFTPSGWQLYARATMLLLLSGQTAVTAPPASATCEAPAIVHGWTTLIGIQCTSIGTWSAGVAGKMLYCFAHGVPPTILSYKGPYASNVTKANTDYSSLPEVIVASAGLVASTKSYFSYRFITATGSISPIVYDSNDIGATP